MELSFFGAFCDEIKKIKNQEKLLKAQIELKSIKMNNLKKNIIFPLISVQYPTKLKRINAERDVGPIFDEVVAAIDETLQKKAAQ